MVKYLLKTIYSQLLSAAESKHFVHCAKKKENNHLPPSSLANSAFTGPNATKKGDQNRENWVPQVHRVSSQTNNFGAIDA